MVTAEAKEVDYLFKLRKSRYVKEPLYKHDSLAGWDYVIDGWEAKDSELKLIAWSKKRRVVMNRRRIPKDTLLAIEHNKNGSHCTATPSSYSDSKGFTPLTGRGRYAFPAKATGAPITAAMAPSIKLYKTWGGDTKTTHCAHGFSATARNMLDK